MPWGMRLLLGNVLAVLGYSLGVPASVYCSACWNQVYIRQLAIAIALLLVVAAIASAITFLGLG